MTDTKDKLRSLFLVALMALSVFGGTIAFTGTVAAASNFSTSAATGGTIGGSGVSPASVSTSTAQSYTVVFNVDDVPADGDTDYFYVEVPTSQGWSLDTPSSSASFETAGGSSISVESSPTEKDADGDGNKEVRVGISPTGGGTVDVDAKFTVKATSPTQSGKFAFNAHVLDSSSNDLTNKQVGTVTVGTLSSRDHDEVFSTPATVFLGEEDVDVSGAGTTAASGSETFSGVAGAADGGVVTVNDVTQVDFTSNNGFETGGYDTNTDGNTDFSVRQPNINDVTLYSGSDTSGADVTNGMIVDSTSRVTVEPEFNFDQADKVEITVTDSQGLEVTNYLLSGVTNPNVVKSGGDWYYVGASGGNFQFNVANLDQQQYNVTLAGDELGAERQVHFTVGDADTSVSLDQTNVVQGETVIATVTGAPGETNYVRIATSDLDDSGTAATAVYDNTGDVSNRTRATVGGTEYVYANLSLGDDGVAKVRIRTLQLGTGTTEVQATDNFGDTEADAEVDLTVKEPKVTISSSPGTVAVGEEFTLNGTAPEVDNVRAFVKVDDTWYPIPGDDSDGVNVESDGEWSLELRASGNLSIPGNYRIGVAGYADGEEFGGTDIDSVESLPNNAWADEVSPTASTSLTSVEGNLSASLARTDVATIGSDEVTLSGHAVGQSDVVAYIVAPRGGVTTESISVDDDNTYSEELSGFTQRGQYEIIVAGNGRDDHYDGETAGNTNAKEAGETSARNLQSENVEVILDYHDGSGIDDPVVRTNLTASNARIQITSDAQLPQEQNVEITGTSNREPGTVLFMEMTNAQGKTVVSGQSEVTASGTWNVTFDLSTVETGTYTLRVEGDEASASMEVEVVEAVTATPTPETPTDTPTPTPTDTPTATPSPSPEPETPTPTETQQQQPGFGLAVSVIALLGAALLALRRD